MSITDLQIELQKVEDEIQLASQSMGSNPRDLRFLLHLKRDMLSTLKTPHKSLTLSAKAPVAHAALRTALQIGLFEKIGDSPIKADELAKRFRLLRVLTSCGIFHEEDIAVYSHSTLSAMLTNSRMRAVIHGMSDTACMMVKLPEYLASRSYQDIEDKFGLFGFFEGTEMTMFEWLEEHPTQLQIFQDFQSAKDEILEWSVKRVFDRAIDTAVSVQTVKRQAGGESNPVLLCDIGGGRGGVLSEICKARPQLAKEGRIVTMDLPNVVAQADCASWNEFVGFDFFATPPIQGACVYLVREVLHNWSDANCRQILLNTRQVMDSKTKLLIADNIIPDSGVGAFMAHIDVSMMAFGGKERTEQDWRELLSGAGFKVDEIIRAAHGTDGADSVIVASLDEP